MLPYILKKQDKGTVMENERIRVGVSSCLLGNQVRYDGGHQRDPYIINTLGQYFDFVPVCPEVECGLPTPRETLRLVGDPENPRLITRETQIDHTGRMKDWASGRLDSLEEMNLCGFIFKSRSPSSGMERIKVYPDPESPDESVKTGRKGGAKPPVLKGVGIFAREYMNRFPLIPVEDDGRLHDPGLRENFIERIFTMKRWRDIENTPASKRVGRLVEFHTRQKLLVMAHSPEHYRDMGRLVARAKQCDPDELFTEYRKLLMTSLSRKATRRKHANVLQHILGYFRKFISADEKQEMLDLIDLHRTGTVPLIVPITIANHYTRKYSIDYLAKQYYLNPHPIELRLRNHL